VYDKILKKYHMMDAEKEKSFNKIYYRYPKYFFKIRLYQRSALSLYIFTLVMDEITKDIQGVNIFGTYALKVQHGDDFLDTTSFREISEKVYDKILKKYHMMDAEKEKSFNKVYYPYLKYFLR
jgi:hypothetical protein